MIIKLQESDGMEIWLNSDVIISMKREGEGTYIKMKEQAEIKVTQPPEDIAGKINAHPAPTPAVQDLRK